MMCSVVRCKSWRRTAQCFILPENPEKRLQWVQFLFEVNGQRLRESLWTDIRVCSEHFTRDCFVTPAADSAQLKYDAVPTVFKPEEPESRQESVQPKSSACESDPLKTSHSPTAGSSAQNQEETTSLISVRASEEVFESSESHYCKMLKTIENLDIIKEKAALLQMNKRYLVNEKQLLQLFSAKCPLCESKVKTEKVIRGVFLVLNQQCLQCDYSKHWENLNKNSITAASNDHQTECMEVSLEMPEVAQTAQVVDEESDYTSETCESRDPMDSDDNWEPEDQPLILESEDESPCEEPEEIVDLKHRELCTDCGKFFDKRKPHTCEYKIKPYSCNICGKRCVNDMALSSHSRVHDEGYEFPCKFCNVTFKLKADKFAHEQIHVTETRPYKCPDCSQTFASNKERRIHLKDHRGKIELRCHYCGLEFFRVLSIQRHLLIHTGAKPYKCSVCQRGFNQASHLKSHMRLHTGERPFKCRHCSKCFNHNVSLKSHVQRYHSAPGHQQTTTGSGCDSGDPKGNEGEDSGDGRVEESPAAKNEPSIKRSKSKRNSTGRPVGRPKRNRTDASLEKKGSDRGINTKTGKGRKWKSKRRPCSIEEGEEELSQSDGSLDLTEEEEQNEKVRSRQKKEDSDFDPTENKRRQKSSKRSKGLRGRPRKKFV